MYDVEMFEDDTVTHVFHLTCFNPRHHFLSASWTTRDAPSGPV